MKRIWCIALLLVAAFASLRAQTFEVSPVYGWARMGKSPLGSSSAESQKDDDTTLRNGYSYGLRFTINTRGYYGHELSYVQSRVGLRVRLQPTADAVKETFESKIRVHQVSYNFLIYFMPKNERWRPYMTGGVESHRYGQPNVENWTGGSFRNYGVNYGAGIKVRLFKNALVRLELRDCITGKPYDLPFEDQAIGAGFIRQQQAAVGVAVTF